VEGGQVQYARHAGATGMQPTTTVVTRSHLTEP
jgi:hypothetical protein